MEATVPTGNLQGSNNCNYRVALLPKQSYNYFGSKKQIRDFFSVLTGQPWCEDFSAGHEILKRLQLDVEYNICMYKLIQSVQIVFFHQ